MSPQKSQMTSILIPIQHCYASRVASLLLSAHKQTRNNQYCQAVRPKKTERDTQKKTSEVQAAQVLLLAQPAERGVNEDAAGACGVTCLPLVAGGGLRWTSRSLEGAGERGCTGVVDGVHGAAKESTWDKEIDGGRTDSQRTSGRCCPVL